MALIDDYHAVQQNKYLLFCPFIHPSGNVIARVPSLVRRMLSKPKMQMTAAAITTTDEVTQMPEVLANIYVRKAGGGGGGGDPKWELGFFLTRFGVILGNARAEMDSAPSK